MSEIAVKRSHSILGVISKIRVKLGVFSSQEYRLSVLMLCYLTSTVMENRRHFHQNFVTVANYINCNIFVKILNVFSVITILLATKLYQGLIFVGIWHTKLKFIFNKVVTQYPNKGAAAKMVRYYNQNDSINNTSYQKYFQNDFWQ